MKDDADDVDDFVWEIQELKNELKKTRQSKKDSYQNWQVVMEAEEVRRTLLDIKGDEEDTFITTSPTVDSTITSTTDTLKRKRTNSNIPEQIGVEDSLVKELEFIGVNETNENHDDSYV